MALAYMTCVPMGATLLQAFNEGESYFQNAVGGLAEVDPLMAPGVVLGVPTAGGARLLLPSVYRSRLWSPGGFRTGSSGTVSVRLPSEQQSC